MGKRWKSVGDGRDLETEDLEIGASGRCNGDTREVKMKTETVAKRETETEMMEIDKVVVMVMVTEIEIAVDQRDRMRCRSDISVSTAPVRDKSTIADLREAWRRSTSIVTILLSGGRYTACTCGLLFTAVQEELHGSITAYPSVHLLMNISLLVSLRGLQLVTRCSWQRALLARNGDSSGSHHSSPRLAGSFPARDQL